MPTKEKWLGKTDQLNMTLIVLTGSLNSKSN